MEPLGNEAAIPRSTVNSYRFLRAPEPHPSNQEYGFGIVVLYSKRQGEPRIFSCLDPCASAQGVRRFGVWGLGFRV